MFLYLQIRILYCVPSYPVGMTAHHHRTSHQNLSQNEQIVLGENYPTELEVQEYNFHSKKKLKKSAFVTILVNEC